MRCRCTECHKEFDSEEGKIDKEVGLVCPFCDSEFWEIVAR